MTRMFPFRVLNRKKNKENTKQVKHSTILAMLSLNINIRCPSKLYCFSLNN